MTLPEHQLVNVQTTAPTNEPLSAADIRAHSYIDQTDDQAYVETLIQAARLLVQDVYLRATTTTTFTYYPKALRGSCLTIPVSPLIAVNSIKYYDADGTQQTFSSSGYRVVTAADPGFVELVSDANWPTLDDRALPVEVEYTAGYGANASDVAAGLRHALMYLVGTWYAQRESVVVGTITAEAPETFSRAMSPYYSQPRV